MTGIRARLGAKVCRDSAPQSGDVAHCFERCGHQAKKGAIKQTFWLL